MILKRTEKEVERHVFNLSSGALCLDFANTVGDRPRKASEHLESYEDLLSWGRQAGILSRSQVGRLARRAARSPRPAERVFKRAVRLRDSLYGVFSALAAGGGPPARHLALLNRELAESLSHLQLCPAEEECKWKWTGWDEAFDGMLWPVARNAADLLTSPEIGRLRECASETCSWLFLDQSRNRRRRWCDMKSCGNRHKARRFYRRKKRRKSGEVRLGNQH